jgi:hypothetical protein
MNSAAPAKRAREKSFVSRKGAKGAKIKKIKMLPVPSSPFPVSGFQQVTNTHQPIMIFQFLLPQGRRPLLK